MSDMQSYLCAEINSLHRAAHKVDVEFCCTAHTYGFYISAVRSHDPGKGHCTAILRRLVAIAQRYGVRLDIDAGSSHRGGNHYGPYPLDADVYYTERAARIYERAGFTRYAVSENGRTVSLRFVPQSLAKAA